MIISYERRLKNLSKSLYPATARAGAAPPPLRRRKAERVLYSLRNNSPFSGHFFSIIHATSIGFNAISG